MWETHGEVEYSVDAEALEYRENIGMSDDEAEYIETVYERLEAESDGEAFGE